LIEINWFEYVTYVEFNVSWVIRSESFDRIFNRGHVGSFLEFIRIDIRI